MWPLAWFLVALIFLESVIGLTVHGLVPIWLEWLGVTESQATPIAGIALVVSVCLGLVLHVAPRNPRVSISIIIIFFASHLAALEYHQGRISDIKTQIDNFVNGVMGQHPEVSTTNSDCQLPHDSLLKYVALSQKELDRNQLLEAGENATTAKRFAGDFEECIRRQKAQLDEKEQASKLLSDSHDARRNALSDSALTFSPLLYHQGDSILAEADAALYAGIYDKASLLFRDATQYFSRAQEDAVSKRRDQSRDLAVRRPIPERDTVVNKAESAQIILTDRPQGGEEQSADRIETENSAIIAETGTTSTGEAMPLATTNLQTAPQRMEGVDARTSVVMGYPNVGRRISSEANSHLSTASSAHAGSTVSSHTVTSAAQPNRSRSTRQEASSALERKVGPKGTTDRSWNRQRRPMPLQQQTPYHRPVIRVPQAYPGRLPLSGQSNSVSAVGGFQPVPYGNRPVRIMAPRSPMYPARQPSAGTTRR